MDKKMTAVLITGASTGIGEACALEMDRRGWRVFAGVRSESDGTRVEGQGSERLKHVILDVTDAESISAAKVQIGNALGDDGLAGLVNNAGIAVPGPLELLPIEDLRHQLEVNVIGQVAVTQAFLPLLRRVAGRIVNMSSISGKVSTPYLGAYTASKFALETISDALRTELRNWHISVSLVEPASVVTPIWGKARAAFDEFAIDVPADVVDVYEKDIEAMRRFSDHCERTGMPVKCVVDKVVHALCARRPKTRYPVGAQTRLAFTVFKFLPDRTRDWLVRRDIGLLQD